MTSALLLVALLFALLHSGLSIYCGDESCYDVLGCGAAVKNCSLRCVHSCVLSLPIILRESEQICCMQHYKALCRVKESANITEIRKRYRALSLESHPDKGGNPELFQRIARAYEVLPCACTKPVPTVCCLKMAE